jgi:hypothetical protein
MLSFLGDLVLGTLEAVAALQEASDDADAHEDLLDYDNVDLPCEGGLRVEVYDGAGNLIPGALVSVPGLAPVRTNARGRAEFHHLQPGTYRATARKLGHRPLRHGSDSEEGRVRVAYVTDLTLFLEPLIELVSLTFTTARDELTNHDTDWDRGGVRARRYAVLDLRHWAVGVNHPVLHVKATAVTLRAVFRALAPIDAPDRGDFRMVIAGTELRARDVVIARAGGGGTFTVDLQAAGFPDRVHRIRAELEWEVQTQDHGHFSGGVGPLEVLVIAGAPVSDGVTIKRMRAAIKLVEAVGSSDPFTVMDALMGAFDTYVLVEDPNVPRKYGHPVFRSFYDAWPLCAPDVKRAGAECQAIVRYCHNVVTMVGLPGTFVRTFVSALPDAPRVAVDETDERRTLNQPRFRLFSLVDCHGCRLGDIRVGEEIIFNSEFRIESGQRVTLKSNNYEACLRLTHGGRQRWYGGGAGTYRSAELVLLDFSGMLEYEVRRIVPGPERLTEHDEQPRQELARRNEIGRAALRNRNEERRRVAESRSEAFVPEEYRDEVYMIDVMVLRRIVVAYTEENKVAARERAAHLL